MLVKFFFSICYRFFCFRWIKIIIALLFSYLSSYSRGVYFRGRNVRTAVVSTAQSVVCCCSHVVVFIAMSYPLFRSLLVLSLCCLLVCSFDDQLAAHDARSAACALRLSQTLVAFWVPRLSPRVRILKIFIHQTRYIRQQIMKTKIILN